MTVGLPMSPRGGELKLVEVYKGVNLYFSGISYKAPALKLYGYASVPQLKRSITRELKKKGKS